MGQVGIYAWLRDVPMKSFILRFTLIYVGLHRCRSHCNGCGMKRAINAYNLGICGPIIRTTPPFESKKLRETYPPPPQTRRWDRSTSHKAPVSLMTETQFLPQPGDVERATSTIFYRSINARHDRWLDYEARLRTIQRHRIRLWRNSRKWFIAAVLLSCLSRNR